MRRLRMLAFVVLAAHLTGCGDIPESERVVAVTTTTTASEVPRLLALADRAIGQREARDALAFVAAVGQYAEAVTGPRTGERASARTSASTGIGLVPEGAPASAHLTPCGGDLPPCEVKQRESGGNYSAVNPTGCGGRGCFGAWQFSGEWAGRLGLPLDLSTATPEQQDAAARELWADGRGCSNWSACR